MSERGGPSGEQDRIHTEWVKVVSRLTGLRVMWQQSEPVKAQVQALREGSEEQQAHPGVWVVEGFVQ
ncbi:g9786 [Coccomyxa elongata]